MILSAAQVKTPDPAAAEALTLAAEIAGSYRLSSLTRLLDAAVAAVREEEIAVAVLGRFKAGKSSFLNHLFGRAVLPVGVVPVTAVVTEVRYGVEASARVTFEDGHSSPAAVESIGAYISEKENPQNVRRAVLVSVELPELAPYRGLKFVDTPGLESVLAHNTRASLEWLPRVGMALVAVAVDPPLAEADLVLLRRLEEHTPRIALLLTKADLVNAAELEEIAGFVRTELAAHLPSPPPVFPYSTRPGFEPLGRALEAELAGVLRRSGSERRAIACRKADTVLRECAAYLEVALRAAETAAAARDEFRRQIALERELAGELEAQTALVTRDAAGRARRSASSLLDGRRDGLERRLQREFADEFPRWKGGFSATLTRFEDWLAGRLREELSALSHGERFALAAPLHAAARQVQHALQQLRDRLSERTARVFGVPLRTTETAVAVREPQTPDVRVGRVFDRSYQLLSPVLPMRALRPALRRHFAGTVARAVEQNLSRLSTQWEAALHRALGELERDARERAAELLGSVDRLLAGVGPERAPELRQDLRRIGEARGRLENDCVSSVGEEA